MLRFFEILAVVVLLGCGFCAARAVWFKPDVVKNVPKNVRSNPGSYRSHYRTYYVRTGGK